jgi:hypothetical protein
MLITTRIRGKWDGKKYVFEEPRLRKVYKGPMAHAKGGGGTTQEFVPTGPWSQQVPYIDQLFQGASNFLQAGPPQYYGGSTVADTTPGLAQSQQNINQATGGATNTLQGSMQAAAYNQQTPTLAGETARQQQPVFNTAVGGLLGQAMNNPTQSAAGATMPAFFSGVNQAAFGGANPIYAPGTDFGNVNANPALMNSLYSNGMNPFTGQIVDAALRTQNRQFGENVLPQISSAANMAGQIGGTRQGIAEGIAGSNQAALQKDIIAQLFGQAFDVGSQERLAALGLVGQGQQGNQNTIMQAQQLAEAQRAGRTNEGLQASQLIGNMLTQGQQLGQQGFAQAGQLSGNMLTSGSAQDIQSQVQNASLLPGLSQAINASLGMQNQVGLQQQAQSQAQRDADVERFFFEQFAPYNLLTQYQNWVTGPYGSSRDASAAGYGLPDNWFTANWR